MIHIKEYLFNNQMKIGVLDSGVGGLTVVKELREILPNEGIYYFGDNAHCPYGNRTEDDIVALTKKMLDFLQEKQVKIVAIACNTISTLIERYQNDYPFPIISIVQAAANSVVESKLSSVGVIATEFTIKTGCYNRLIQEQSPQTEVWGEPSRNLAMLIDSGEFDMQAIREDVFMHTYKLMQEHPVNHLILGCTHYPIVSDLFQEAAPEVTLINPARSQALAVKRSLEEKGLLLDTTCGEVNIYTSGSPQVYHTMLTKLGIRDNTNIHTV